MADESAPASRVARFGAFQLDLRSGELVGNGQRQLLPDQPLTILTLLLQHPGELVLRDELRRQLWSSDTFVDFEHGLNAAVKRLRAALGDSADAPRYIETVPRRGYRLIAPVVGSVAPTPDASIAFDGSAAPAPRAADARSVARSPDAEADTRTVAPVPGARNPVPGTRPRRRAPLAVVAGLATAVVVILAALAVAQYVRARGTVASGEPTPRVRSLAVLPFEDLSAGKDVPYADGLTELLIAELSTLDGLDKVIGRQSVARYRAAPIPVRDAARALEVDAVVTASVLRSAGRLRVTARLVDGLTERHLWAATYERPDGEVLLIQRDIVEAIVGAIHLVLGQMRSPECRRARPVDVAAFDAYIAGRGRSTPGRSTRTEAIGHFETATPSTPSSRPRTRRCRARCGRGAMLGIPPMTRTPGARSRRPGLLPSTRISATRTRPAGVLTLYGDWDWGRPTLLSGRAAGAESQQRDGSHRTCPTSRRWPPATTRRSTRRTEASNSSPHRTLPAATCPGRPSMRVDTKTRSNSGVSPLDSAAIPSIRALPFLPLPVRGGSMTYGHPARPGARECSPGGAHRVMRCWVMRPQRACRSRRLRIWGC